LKIKLLLLLAAASILASSGQILLKLGADRARSLIQFINPRIILGLLLYGVSTAIWIYALSFARLNVIYAFTTLTFVLVYIFSYFILKEALNVYGIAGILFVLSGLYLILFRGSV